MRHVVVRTLEDHLRVLQSLHDTCVEPIEEVARRFIVALRAGSKVLVMGNGGSAADAQHLAAELVGRFTRERQALPALALTTDTSVLTALSNDYGYPGVFKRQVEAHARPGDVVVGISTSGNSENVCLALAEARKRGAVTIALGGGSGGRLKELADVALIVPSTDTQRIQEAHITIIHILCDLVESAIMERPR